MWGLYPHFPTHTGVIGVFNCQGAGSWPCQDRINTVEGETSSYELSGQVSPSDIEYLEEEVSGNSWTGKDYAVFSFNSGSLSQLSKQDTYAITLKTMECNVFTVSPMKMYKQSVKFASIGLINMYNSGGAVEAVEIAELEGSARSSFGIKIKGKGASGCFGAYSNPKPKLCLVNFTQQNFEFNTGDHFLRVIIPSDANSWEITLCY